MFIHVLLTKFRIVWATLIQSNEFKKQELLVDLGQKSRDRLKHDIQKSVWDFLAEILYDLTGKPKFH